MLTPTTAPRTRSPRPTTRRPRTAACLLAALAASAVLASPAAAQTSDRPIPYVEVTDHNAALLYYNAWLSMAPDLDDALDDTGDGYGVAEGGREILEQASGTIEAFLRASRQDHADWEIEYELGPNALLPYLGKLRHTSKVLAADALRCAEDGDADGAAERVAAIYRMSQHVSGDRILISSLVGMAMSNFADTIGAQLAERGGLTPEAAGALAEAMADVDLDDPFGMRGAVIGERDIMGNYFIENFDGPDAGRRVLGFSAEMLGQAVDPDSSPLGSMSGEELRRDIQGFRRYYDDVLVIWNEPDAADRIDALAAGIQSGEYGEFAKLFAASLAKSRANVDRFRKDHDEAIEKMRTFAAP